MKRYYLFMVSVVISVTGCSTPLTLKPSLRTLDVPPIGEERSVEIGDTLMEKAKIYEYDGIFLKDKVSRGDGFLTVKIVIPPGELAGKKQDKKYRYYYSDESVIDQTLGMVSYGNGGLCIPHDKTKNIYCFYDFGSGDGSSVRRLWAFKPGQLEIEPTTVTDVKSPYYKQELIYNGRSEDNLRFLYREYTGDHLRAPFSQEIQYDLSQTDIIGFKGARVQIIEATNFNLKYKVLKSFPDQP